MSDKDAVLAHLGPHPRYTVEHDEESEWWSVYVVEHRLMRKIGSGPSEAAAWYMAAKGLEK